MANQRESHLRLPLNFNAAGVNTAQAQAVAPEDSLFQCNNMFVDLKGTLRKRHAISEYGAPILEPTPPVADNAESISTILPVLSHLWVEDTTGIENGYTRVGAKNDLILYAGQSSTTSGEASIAFTKREEDAYNDDPAHNESFSVGFNLRASNLPAFTNGTLKQPGIFVKCGVKEDAFVQIGFFNNRVAVCYLNDESAWGGLNYVGDLQIDDGKPHTVVVTMEPNTEAIPDVVVYIDGVAHRFAEATYSTWEFPTNDTMIEFNVMNDTSLTAPIVASIWNIFVRDSNENAYNHAVVNDATTTSRLVSSSNRTEYKNLILTNSAVWAVTDFSTEWTYLHPMTQIGRRMSVFRGKTMIFDLGPNLSRRLWELDDNNIIREMEDAPPAAFGCEHMSRFFMSGDPRFPLRFYYSAIRNANVWFAPDNDADGQESEDEVLNAGWIEVDGDDDEWITALYGNFYSSLVICTNKAAYLLSGSGASSWSLNKITDSVGAFNQESVVKVNNDLVCFGPNGVDYLKAVEQYGDVISNKLSGDIQDIFSLSGEEVRKVNQQAAFDTAGVAFHRQSGLLYLYYPGLGSTISNTIYVYNLSTQKWYGSWSLDMTSMNSLTTGFPLRESILFGDESGSPKVFSPFADGDCSVMIESQVLDGRSMDPTLSMMEKNWGRLRLLINPTGKWEVTVNMKTEDSKWKTVTKTVEAEDSSRFSDGARFDMATFGNSENTRVLDIPVEMRGRTLRFEITSSAPILSFLRAEVDFTVAGYERT